MQSMPASIGLQHDMDAEQLARFDSARRQYECVLMRHPDPRDPDYPGDMDEFIEEEMER